jgi:hypothetical protein
MLNQAGLGLVVGAQAGAGQRREGGESEKEVEAEPHRRAAVPRTAGIGLGGSSRWPGRIAKRESLERAREMIVLQKHPPLAKCYYLSVKLPGSRTHLAPLQQIRRYAARCDHV